MITQCPTCGTETPDSAFESWVGLSELQSRCASLITDIANQPEVSDEEHAANKPGGPANPATNAQGWLWYLCWLHRKQAGSPLNAVKPTLPPWSDSDRRDLRDMLEENPVYVPLANGETKAVYPKGEYAADRIGFIDAALAFVVPRIDALKEAEPSAEQLEGLQRAIEHRAQLHREFIWIVTHPGADVPWDDDGQWDHVPPPETRNYDGFDIDQFFSAYLEVNFRRLTVVSERTRAYKKRGDGESMTAETFMGVMAGELGISPRELSRKWSKGMLFAYAFTKWEVNEQAEARASKAA